MTEGYEWLLDLLSSSIESIPLLVKVPGVGEQLVEFHRQDRFQMAPKESIVFKSARDMLLPVNQVLIEPAYFENMSETLAQWLAIYHLKGGMPAQARISSVLLNQDDTLTLSNVTIDGSI